jgi:hypothetical protein
MDTLFMYSSSNSKVHGRAISITLAASLLLAACGGAGGTDPSPPPSTPAIADNVLFSITPGIGVVATINKAGYLRAYDMSSGQPVTIALGNAPMKGTGTSAVGNGWLSSSGIFAQSTVTLNSNPGASTYTLTAQSTSGRASNTTMQLATNLVTPTLPALAGDYGMTSDWTVVINGNSFTGTYDYSCSWSGTLSPNSKTIDVTNIRFENNSNITGLPCPYVGKAYTGTAHLIGPSAAYAKGAFVIIFDDGGSNIPTMMKLYNFIRQ